jgi:ABC-type dipeptide/oligopeptide/nickel transport system permease component
LKRLLWALFLALTVATLAFVVVNAIPGDPVDIILGDTGVQGYIDVAKSLRHQLGLDLPLHVRYVRWMTNLATGNLGTSLYTDTPVLREIGRTAPHTVELIAPAVVIGVGAGIALGMLTAIRRGTVWDNVISWLGILGYSLPVYISGTFMIYILSVLLGWLPPSGYVDPSEQLSGFARHAIMPVLALALTITPITMRMTRSTMLEALGQDYVRTARAKGVPLRRLYVAHVLRNALIPVIAVVGLQIGYLFGGTVVTELVFNWPGLSTYLFFGIFKRDYPVVQGVVLLSALIFIMVNLLSDLSYGLVDPRVQYG